MPCNRCRTRHYRCDGKQPACGRFQFLDESSEIRSQYVQDGYSPFGSPSVHVPSPSGTPGSAQGTALTPSSTLFTPTENLTVLSLLNSESPVQQQTTAPPVLHDHRANTSAYHPHHDEGVSTFVYQQPPGEPVLWPLEHEQEAMLLQHYIENVALFFDMVDTRDHFGVHIVQMAKQNSTLMNAILALSARQLSRTTDFDPYIADAYYQRCFDTLIPALNDNVTIKEEPLLAATVILRLLEEMNISIIGSDPQGHLFGTQAIIRAAEQSYAATSGPDRRQAIYWAAFRQELWISLMTQRAFKLHIFPADRSLEPANDSIWATRTIAHLGDVSNFVFGEGRNSIARYNQLMDENRSWTQCRPDSFDPYYFRQDRDGSGRNFPDIRFHQKTHVMGTQYNLLAHMLLIVHDPTIPQLGPAHKASRAVVDRTVQDNVRTLCGVAQSNSKWFPCKFVACFAIALVGDRFTLREDQEQLRDLWYACERSHGFPPTATIAQLEESWGWHNS
ncbi:putative Zn(II)2Cys6 transcription factor (Eurofung) [Alternaria alternata]|nr:putative Zn(II)2Cys6 transcription factor (Eurofung) [Alternaria alternata]